MSKEKNLFKCCYNCANGFECASTYPVEEIFNLTQRFCCASYPVSSHGEDAFKQRYCKQFEPNDYKLKFRKLDMLTKEEAIEMSKINKEKVKTLRNSENQ